MSGRVKILLGIGAVALIAGFYSIATREPSPREQLRTLRIELQALRDSAEACTAALSDEQAEFKQYESRVDSMRERIDLLESLVPNGVPADSYSTYLSTVDSFNAAVPDWRPAADSLAAFRRACRQRIDAHTALADSVRALAQSLGLLDPTPNH